jgi:hypothetical protein
MDRLTRYRTLIKKHLTRVAELVNQVPGNGVETLCAFDERRDQYLLLRIGWTGHKRTRGITLFVRLKEGKILIEEDWTEDGIFDALVKAGVPDSEIVLALHSPAKRRRPERAAV